MGVGGEVSHCDAGWSRPHHHNRSRSQVREFVYQQVIFSSEKMRVGFILSSVVALAAYGFRDQLTKFGPWQRLIPNADKRHHSADEIWTLSTHKFIPNHYQAAPYIANGYFGQ